MSYLAQEIMGFGKPSRLVQNILNGTDNIVSAKKETSNLPQCPQCGRPTLMRFIDGEHQPKHIFEVWECNECKKRFRFMFKIDLISVHEIIGEC